MQDDLVLSRHGDIDRLAREGKAGKPDHPFAVRTGNGIALGGSRRDGDLLPRIGGPPDGGGPIALQDHVIAEERGKRHIGEGRADGADSGKEDDGETLHGERRGGAGNL